MSFLDKVPSYRTQLEAEIKKLDVERLTLDWGHDCDCEYCDRQGDGEDAEQEDERLKREIKARKRMIARLERYEAMFNE